MKSQASAHVTPFLNVFATVRVLGTIWHVYDSYLTHVSFMYAC